MLKFSAFVVLILVEITLAVEYVPALVWESGSLQPWKQNVPGLRKMSTESFKDFVFAKSANRDLLLVFAEENLSVEDFIWQDEEGSNFFSRLNNVSSDTKMYSRFLSAVENPMEALLSLDQQWEELTVTSDLPTLLATKKHNSRILVHLDDAADSEDRPDMLHRHDTLVADAINAAREAFDRVLIIYTGYHSSWVSPEENIRKVRSLMAAEEPSNDTLFINANDIAFFYSSSNIVFTINEEIIVLSDLFNTSASEEEEEEGAPFLRMTIEYGKEEPEYIMVLNFYNYSTSGYWHLPTINITRGSEKYTLTTQHAIIAPLRFCYHCSQDIVFEDNTSETTKASIVIKDLQVQPYPTDTGRFSDAYDCVWFFTVPIWSGLGVSILFVLILTLGLCMILDIKTMDRFDDPKGKTITITATD